VWRGAFRRVGSAGVGLRRSEHQIAGEHRALGKSPRIVLRGSAPNFAFDSLRNPNMVSRAGARLWECLARDHAPDLPLDPLQMRAMSMSHQAHASPGPKLNESGPSGRQTSSGRYIQDRRPATQVVPRRAESVQKQDERSATSALPSVPPVTHVRSPPRCSSRMNSPLSQYTNIAATRRRRRARIRRRVVGRREQRALLVGLDLVDDVLNLLRTDFVVLAEPESLDHCLLSPADRLLRSVGRLIEQQCHAQRQHDVHPQDSSSRSG